jgi:hypothetical protein
MTTPLISTFTRAYIEAALWSTTDDNDKPLDEKYGIDDFAAETLQKIVADCERFQEENVAAINGDYEQAGHDFWFTRNGHGVGFWDGDWAEPNATILDNASKHFGECWLYVGDDGKLYL